MKITKNMIKAVVTAIIVKRFWNGQNLSPRMPTSDQGKKECFDLMLATIPDAVADEIIECGESVNRTLIMETFLLWTNPSNAEDAMLSIVDALHNKFSYDI